MTRQPITGQAPYQFVMNLKPLQLTLLLSIAGTRAFSRLQGTERSR